MASPRSAGSRFDAKSQTTEKIKPGQTWKSFLVNAGAGLVSVSDPSQMTETRAEGRCAGKNKVMPYGLTNGRSLFVKGARTRRPVRPGRDPGALMGRARIGARSIQP